jgi:hypothetical protein
VTAREKRLIGALRIIACIPQAYHSRGPEVVRDEMERVAREAIRDEDSRAVEKAHEEAMAADAVLRRVRVDVVGEVKS